MFRRTIPLAAGSKLACVASDGPAISYPATTHAVHDGVVTSEANAGSSSAHAGCPGGMVTSSALPQVVGPSLGGQLPGLDCAPSPLTTGSNGSMQDRGPPSAPTAMSQPSGLSPLQP
jgi:hypothetical protein